MYFFPLRKEYNMLFLLFFLFLVFTFTFTFTCTWHTTAYSAAPPQMRVGISLPGNHLDLSFGDSYTLLNMATGTPLQLPPGRYRLVNAQNSIQVLDILENSRGVFSGPLYLKPLFADPTGQSFELHNACYGSEYRGALEVFPEGGTLVAVNIIDLEAYLRGVVPREMPASWGNYGGMEALKAQAVAARSYALFNQAMQQHNGYHVCDTIHCQAYGGKSSETVNTDNALDQTKGEVLTYNGRVIQPFYHATNGGYCELVQNVWNSGSLPYFSSVHDPFDDPANPLGLSTFIEHRYASWKTDRPVDFLRNLLVYAGFTNPGEVQKVEVVSTFPSGRVAELRIQGTTGAALSLYKQEARMALDLRSQLYTVSSEPGRRVWIAFAPEGAGGVEVKESFAELEGKWVLSGHALRNMLIGDSFPVLGFETRGTVPYPAFVFEGHGYGHGIGMSQNGAYNRSRAGEQYSDILAFYYPGTDIETGY